MAMRSFEVKEHENKAERRKEWVVQDRNNPSRRFTVEEVCECLELEKTGVACAHLIATALVGNRSYKNMISTRWSTQVQSKHL